MQDESNRKTVDKKVWQTLKLETLDVPSATESGVARLDPAEGFYGYRPS